MADDFIKSALKTAGRGAISGMGAVGNALDLPGSMVRDLLALKNPLDQLLSPFSDENRTTGRDLLRQYGLADKNKDTWGNWAGGLALEFGTDPLTYFGLPGLSKAATAAGKVGAKAGIVSDDVVRAAIKKTGAHMSTAKTLGTRAGMTTTLRDVLEHVAKRESERFPKLMEDLKVAASASGHNLNDIFDQPMRGLTQFQVPFFKNTERVIGTAASPTALKIADAVDTAHDLLTHNPVMDTLTPLFSKAVKGYGEKIGRFAGRTAMRGQREAESASRAAIHAPIEDLDASGLFRGDQADVLRNSNEARKVVEGIGSADPNINAIKPSLDEMSAQMSAASKRETGMGLKSNTLGDQAAGLVDYFPRYKNDIPQATSTFMEQLAGRSLKINTHNASQMARQKILTGLPGGTEVLQRMSVDPVLSGVAKKANRRLTMQELSALADDIAKRYPDALWSPSVDEIRDKLLKSGKFPSGHQFTAQELAAGGAKMQRSRSMAMARYLSNLPLEHVTQNQPLFNMNLADDAMKRISRSHEAVGNARALYNYIGDTAEDIASDGSVSVWDMLKRPGLSQADAAAQVAFEMTGQQMSPADVKKFLQAKHIPQKYAQEMQRVYRPFQEPQEVSKVMQHVDRYTRAFKSMVTSAFPSFSARNRGSGFGQNVLGEAYDARRSGPNAYIGPANDAEALLSQEVVKGSSDLPFAKAQGLDDIAATHKLRQMGFAHKWGGAAAGPYSGDMNDIMASAVEQIPGGKKDAYDFRTPGKAWNSIQQHAYNAFPKTPEQANALNIEGVGADVTKFAPVAAGQALGRHGESVNRLSGAIGYLSQGYSPEAADAMVRKYHVDYGDLTDFERQYMRRLFPFYSFSKGAAKQVADDLLTKPGGRLRQAIRVSDSLKGDDPTTPDYVADTAAIPLGQSEDGTKRYVTGFGLAYEDPLSFAGGGVRGAGLEALSRMNPLVKGPTEYFTGQTFFQKEPGGGRSLDDADPTLGRIAANVTGQKNAVKFPGSQAVEVGLSNSPLARVASTVRSVTDPRKDILSKVVNNVTGVRVSDISPAAQDAVLRDKVENLLRKYPESRRYTKTFINKEELATMSPERRAEMQSLQDIMNELSKRASSRAKAKKAAAQ